MGFLLAISVVGLVGCVVGVVRGGYQNKGLYAALALMFLGGLILLAFSK